MKTLGFWLVIASLGGFAWAQDAGTQAAQQAQMAAQAAQQANQQAMEAAQRANEQAMRDAQQANQTAQNASQAGVPNTICLQCFAAVPKFSLKAGTYSSPVTVKMKDATRGAVIYYTTDGWTPTTNSARYTGPITIDSTTTLQAIAVSPYGGRSRVASAVYTLDAPSAKPASQSLPAAAPNPPTTSSGSATLLLPRDTVVPLVFAADVSSKSAEVGDQLSLTLAEDLKAGDTVLVKKGTPAVATVTEVDTARILGVPGEVYFQVNYLQAGDTRIKLRGGAAKEGQDKVVKAASLMVVPVPVGFFVHGKQAEIKQGTPFTAFLEFDTVLPPAN